MELAFYTSSELIDELAQRSTFVGLIVRSEKEFRSENPILHQKWDITYAKLTAQQVCELLQDATEHFRQLAENE